MNEVVAKMCANECGDCKIDDMGVRYPAMRKCVRWCVACNKRIELIDTCEYNNAFLVYCLKHDNVFHLGCWCLVQARGQIDPGAELHMKYLEALHKSRRRNRMRWYEIRYIPRKHRRQTHSVLREYTMCIKQVRMKRSRFEHELYFFDVLKDLRRLFF